MRYAAVGLIGLLFVEPIFAQNKPMLVPNTDGHTARVNRVRFTPDGQNLISVSNDKTIRIWHTNSGRTLRVLRPPIGPGAEGLLAALAVAPNGKSLAVGGYPIGGGRLGFPIYLIELPTGRISRLLYGHTGPITDLAFSPDGKQLASTSYDKSVRVWEMGGDPVAKEKILLGHEHFVTGVAWSPDGQRLITGSFDRTARLWSLPDGQCDAILTGHTKEVFAVAWSRDGKTLATGGDDRAVRLWSANGKPGKVFANLGNRITSLTFTRLSKALIVTRGGPDALDFTCSVLWFGTDNERVKFMRHTGTVMNGTLSPDGQLAATCGGLGHEIYIWSIVDGSVWNRLGGRSRGAMSAAWSQGGTLIAWGHTNKGSTFQANLPLERAFRPSTLEFVDPAGAKFTRATVARGSLNLALGAQNRVDLRLGGDVLQVLQFPDPSNRVRCFSFLTADRVVLGGTKSLELFDTTSSKCVRVLHGHSDEVWAVAPAPNRRYLLSASLDQTVRVWDAEALLRPEVTSIGVSLRVEDDVLVVVGILPGTPAAQDGRLRVRDRLVAVAGNGNLFVPVKGRKLAEVMGMIDGPADSTVGLRIRPPDKNEEVEYAIRRQRPAGWVGQVEPLFSLFLNENNWMAWTPEGYYAASPGGEKIMGWHINNGTDRMATFLPAERFARSLNRPDILMQALETGSVERALALADLVRGIKTEPINIVQVLPPRVKITSPAESGGKVDEDEIDVTATAESTGKHPVTAMRLLIDGRPFQGLKGLKRFDAAEPGTVRATWKVSLTTGRHRLIVQADSSVSQGDSEPVEVSYAVDSPQQPGRLFVLAIGIAAYKDSALKLNYSASDAKSFAQRLKEKGSPLPFQEVRTRVLTDEKATREAILRDGFAWLQKEAKPTDSICVFYSGHGERGTKGGLFLLPVDVDVKDLEKTGISDQELKTALVSTPGRQVLLILDACHAGAAFIGQPSAVTASSALTQELGRDENGIIVMCSSTDRQSSQENNENRQSNYTHALLEGLRGKGQIASKDGIVYQHRLSGYVIDRVMELSQKMQRPTECVPPNVPLFPLTRP